MPNNINLPVKDDSLISGGLAGILAASVFGGPIGAAIGLGTGLLSKRMHQNELDLLADDYNAVQEYGSGIQDQIKTTSAYLDKLDASGSGYDSSADREQLGSIAEEAYRASRLAQHYDANIRNGGFGQLISTGAKFGALHNDIKERTQHLADQQYALENEQRLHYQSEFEKTQNQVRELTSSAEQARFLVKNDTAIKNVETKSALMHLLGMTTREADQDASSFSIGLLGTGYQTGNIDDFSPSYDDAVKIIESVEQTKLKAAGDYLAQLAQTAQKQGYTFAKDSDGKVSVKTINSVVEQFRQSQAMPALSPQQRLGGAAGSVSGSSNAADTAAEVLNSTISGAQSAGAAVGDAVSKGTDTVLQYGADSIEAAKKWIHENVRNKRKRPTNK